MGNRAKPANNNSSTPTQSSQANVLKVKLRKNMVKRRARRAKQLQNNLLMAQQIQYTANNSNQKNQKANTIPTQQVKSINELFKKLASQNNVKASSKKVPGSKNSSVIPIGATCGLCGITFYEEKLFHVHRQSDTHQKLYEMSQAKETAVRQLLKAHTALMVERDNVKLDDDLIEKKDPCPVCIAYCKDTDQNHKKTPHHQLAMAYKNRKCDFCQLKINGQETEHQRQPHHMWEQIEAERKHESRNFDSAFNMEENLPLSIKNDLRIRELVSEVKFKIDNPNLISLTDYDPSMPLGLNFILPRFSNYCLVCKREVQKAHTDHQKGAILSSEMHCRSYVHYTKLAKALQDHEDELLENERGPISGDKKGSSSAADADAAAAPLPETEALTDTEVEEEVLTMIGVEATEVVTDTESEEEVLKAVMDGIESTVVPVTFEDEEEADAMDGIESPVAIDIEIEEETETASVKELESAAAVASKSNKDVKVDGHDESSAEVPAKESNVGSTQQKEDEELSKKVALIGDSWIQDFPLETLPDEWNVSKFGWKLASAKAFLVREDVQSVIDMNPSVAVLHLGANDICKKYSCGSICCDILDIVKLLEEENITTLVCEIPLKTAPQKISESDYDTVRQKVNASLVQKLSKSTSVVHISDLQEHLIDGVDLSADGYAKFSDAIKTMIESKFSDDTT